MGMPTVYLYYIHLIVTILFVHQWSYTKVICVIKLNSTFVEHHQYNITCIDAY